MRTGDHLSLHDDCSPPQLRPTRVSVKPDSLATNLRLNSTLFGLAPDGVCQAAQVTLNAGALLPHRFTLTTHGSVATFTVASAHIVRRFTFCCTFPNLAIGRRYRPSRPAEPGLSSSGTRPPAITPLTRNPIQR